MDEIWRGICLRFLSNISKVIENALKKTQLLFCKKSTGGGGGKDPLLRGPCFWHSRMHSEYLFTSVQCLVTLIAI